MSLFFKWFAIVIGAVLLVLLLFFMGMRFHDGPLEIISGGPFKTGTPTPSPEDWGFLAGRSTIDFQTMEPATSRKVWFLVHEGRLFIVSGYMTTGYGKLWKQWPHYLEADNRVILRIDGKLYEQQLQRIQSGAVIAPVMAEFGAKYGYTGTAEAVTSGYSWLYELLPRE